MRVLIVDDHRIVASGCRALFADDPEIDIVEAADAEAGERVFRNSIRTSAFSDINLPTVSGFELARRILSRDASARIIMFSMNDDPAFAAHAIEIGAKGYVSKTGDPQDLVEAIRRGRKWRSSICRRRWRGSIAFAGPAFARRVPLAKLTSRELEILRLLSVGKSLSRSHGWSTPPTKRSRIHPRSCATSSASRTSAELVRLAIENGAA